MPCQQLMDVLMDIILHDEILGVGPLPIKQMQVKLKHGEKPCI